jgi:hypothetical protein
MEMEDSSTIMEAHEDVGDDARSSIEAGEDAEESPERMSSQLIKFELLGRSIQLPPLKPSSLSRMMAPLCRLVAMPIMRLTLSSDLALFEVDFIHGYQEGAALFYLSTTNEGGLVDKVTDEDL